MQTSSSGLSQYMFIQFIIDSSFVPLLPSEYFKLNTPCYSESVLLDIIISLQSINQNLKLLNTTLSNLSEDMVSIETLLITRELLVQDLAGLPTSVDAFVLQPEPGSTPSTSRYLLNLYQKLANTSISYTHTAQAYIQS